MGARRGAITRSNDNGTLERVDGTNTYIGTATLPSGKVLTKRFRGSWDDEDEIARRWEKWQCRHNDDEDGGEYYFEEGDDNMEETKRTGSECPISGYECKPNCPMFSVANGACSIMLGGTALYNISANVMELKADEPIELVAMAVQEVAKAMADMPRAVAQPVEAPVLIKHEPTPDDSIAEFLKDRNFMDFVNLHSKRVNADMKRFCEERGLPRPSEKELVAAIDGKFPELKAQGVSGGTVFKAA